jgi:uncharacterized membrane-anchored protein YhcB (DUF1043 family)
MQTTLADWLAGLLVLVVGVIAPVGVLATRYGLLGRAVARDQESKLS